MAFSLIDEVFIPVRPSGGGPIREVSLLELLTHAREFERIDDPSPLVTVALYRLCLAILHRALSGPADAAQAAQWYVSGFPAGKIEAYLSQHAERFDLFHPDKPFMQDWRLSPEALEHHWSLISSEHGSYGTNLLFGARKRVGEIVPPSLQNATYLQLQGTISPANAARNLIQHQTFALGGRTTGASDSQADSPSASSALVMVLGDSFQETMCLNLLPYPKEMIQNDLPVWEWSNQEKAKERFSGRHVITGYTDRYTWLARGVRLQPQTDEQGQIRVGWVSYGGGVTPISEASGQYLDPMGSYVPLSNDKDKLRTIKLDPARLLWRDISALLPNSHLPPLTVIHAQKVLSELQKTERTGETKHLSRAERMGAALKSNRSYLKAVPVIIFGMVRSKQKIELYRHEEYTLPQAFIDDPQTFTNQINAILSDTDRVGNSLNQAIKKLVYETLSNAGTRKIDPGDVTKLMSQLPAEATYWARLEAPFRQYLAELDDPERATGQWHQALRRITWEAWNLALLGVGNGAAALRAASIAKRILLAALRPLEPPTPQENPA